MSAHSLTICSVSYHSKNYLELNRRLVEHLNPSTQVEWVVVENTPAGDSDRLTGGGNGVTVYEGYEYDPQRKRPASFHHAIGLNKAVRLARTRFVLVLDPDFYIIRKNWAYEVLRHMEAHGLAFLGAPWHPRWYIKYRYFPCVHCLFIDLDRVEVENLDFTPGQDDPLVNHEPATGVQQGSWAGESQAVKRLIPLFVRRAVRTVQQTIEVRKYIGSSRDTGCQVYERYAGRNGYKAECLVPVYRLDSQCLSPQDRFNRLLDRLLPDRLSYLPKRAHYYTQTAAHDFIDAEAVTGTWEEFVWQGEPFGFHVRGYQPTGRDLRSESAALDRIVSDLTST